MRTVFMIAGILTGSIGGMIAGGCAGWLVVRMIDGPDAFLNPDLPGGMAWLLVILAAAVGLLPGGIAGNWLGKSLFREWQHDRQETSDAESG